jgi:hypothetical protein
MENTAAPRQIRATYNEANDVWMVALGHYQTPGDDRDWTVDEYLNDGFDGYSESRWVAESDAHKWAYKRMVPVLPPYDPRGMA